jgi:murein DD-endopeptidase MepM/ murein hydrolase activator NlpD
MASSGRVYPPLPITGGVSYGKPGYADWAFNLPDPEGMPSSTGNRHGAVDWFAAGGAPVHAATGGKVVEVKPQTDRSGQVFGGTVKVQDSLGRVWVYRHVNPRVSLGSSVYQGQRIANVTDWTDGPDHLHMEVWRSLAGGYRFSNAIDPKSFEYTEAVVDPPGRYYFERIVDGETALTWGPYSRKVRRDAYYLLIKAAHPSWGLRKYSRGV